MIRSRLQGAAELQAAVNAYAAIGVPAGCATYRTVNQGGVITQDVCTVSGSTQYHDAGLTAAMTPAQLAAELALEQRAAQNNDFSSAFSAPDTKRVSAVVSVPTVTTAAPPAAVSTSAQTSPATAQPSSAASSTASSTATVAGLPQWVLPAAAIVVVLLVLRK